MPAIASEPGSAFLFEHADRIPAGDLAFLGAGRAAEIVHLARLGCRITVFESDSSRLDTTRDQVETAGFSADWQLTPGSGWRLGFERWSGVIALYPSWTLAEQRRLLRQVPCALKPGGCFLFEGWAEGPGGPTELDSHQHDPEEFRDALDVLQLGRCARIRRPARPGLSASPWILQVLGRHREAEGEVREPIGRQCPAPKAASRRPLSLNVAGAISRPSSACAAPYSAR